MEYGSASLAALGVVQGEICPSKQIRCILNVRTKARCTDCGGCRYRCTAALYRLPHVTQNRFDERLQSGAVPGAGHQQHEFVTTKPCHMGVSAVSFTQPSGSSAQHLVTRLMTQRVIDRLEVIEIEQEQGKRLILRSSTAKRVVQSAFKSAAVRGVTLKHGDMILIPTALHGLDEDENVDAMKLDIHRKKIAHMTFGGGPHRCAGMHLARMEAIVTLQEWLKRIPEFHIAHGSHPTFRSGIIAAVDYVQLEWSPPVDRAA